MSPNRVTKIGIIVGSTRVVRIAPQVANFVLETIQTTSTSPGAAAEFDIVDLATINLPMYDEPGIPKQIRSADDYVHEHTRSWSRRISSLDGFIIVTAQRNWGIAAELKNSIDYLYNEWSGKPLMIVTYGGHGGNHCADQLRTVLGSMGVRVCKEAVGMSFPSPEFRDKSFKGEELGLDATDDRAPWAEYRANITAAWEELSQLLVE